jgi:hypothetical protein
MTASAPAAGVAQHFAQVVSGAWAKTATGGGGWPLRLKINGP